MKRLFAFLLVLALVSPLTARQGGGGGGGASWGGSEGASRSTWGATHPPMVIKLGKGASGGHNRNFPIQQPTQWKESQPPSYGKVHGPSAGQPPSQQPAGTFEQSFHPVGQRASVKTLTDMGIRAANVIHHHPYSPGYVRQKLQNIGVKTEPSYITDRAEIIHTDRLHSTIPFPKTGPEGKLLSASAFSPRSFNDRGIRDQMARINGGDWRATVGGLNRTETQADRYYWHQGNGFNYCHYIDHYGYHWYGWYLGDRYFWTRYFGNRWWWYDWGFNRWCFWNDGFWWWQDPYHLGDLYCYDDYAYIPCNSAQDQIVVTAADNPALQIFLSPDGTRVVKLDKNTRDAFLYDTAKPPAFEPIYLASGAVDVQFSDTANGRPLQIILKLEDGSYDMFDGDGNSYNPMPPGAQ